MTGDGGEVKLTPTEWKLLEAFVRHPGKLIGQRQLLTEVWGPQYTTDTGYLRLYLSQLRKKLEPDPSNPRFLVTEPWVGYRQFCMQLLYPLLQATDSVEVQAVSADVDVQQMAGRRLSIDSVSGDMIPASTSTSASAKPSGAPQPSAVQCRADSGLVAK